MSRSARDDRAAALEQLVAGAALHPADDGVARACRVALTGDLRLVHHEPDEAEARAVGDGRARFATSAGSCTGER